MTQHWIAGVAFAIASFQAAPASDRAAVSPQMFVGTWVGTQTWNVGTPPPGLSAEQPVSLTIELAGDKLTGTLTPFMGGDDGAVFVDVQIVGDELRATGAFGQPPAPAAGAGVKAAPVEEDEGLPRIVPANRVRRSTWKDTVRIQFAFKADRLDLKGTSDVLMNGVRWLGFKYDLGKKRARY